MNDTGLYDIFRNQVQKARGNGCDGAVFYDLSKQAVQIYVSHPELGEEIAGQMTDLWYHNSANWNDATTEYIGQLFADLDVPPSHVAGGTAGAQQKWQLITERIYGATEQQNHSDAP